MFEARLGYCFKKYYNLTSQVTLFMSLIKILDMFETRHEDVIIKVIGSLLKISNSLVHYKLCELIQRKWNVAEVPKTLVDILAQPPNQRYSN